MLSANKPFYRKLFVSLVEEQAPFECLVDITALNTDFTFTFVIDSSMLPIEYNRFLSETLFVNCLKKKENILSQLHFKRFS